MKVTREGEDPQESLESVSFLDESYNRQGESIVLWSYNGQEVALSFKDKRGCADVWKAIQTVQGHDFFETESQTEDDSDNLPVPALETLDEINSKLGTCQKLPSKKAIAIRIVMTDDFLPKLFEVFSRVEASGNEDKLRVLCSICKSMVNLGDLSLIEILCSDENYLPFFGCLEYDEEKKYRESHNHRNFLSEEVKFRTCVEIEDQEIVNKIHVNYRLSYLKDTALAYYLDYQISGSIMYAINNNNSFMMSRIKDHINILTELVAKLKIPDTRTDALNFLTELTLVSKTVDVQIRRDYFVALGNEEFFESLDYLLQDHLLGYRQLTQHELIEIMELVIFFNQYANDLLRAFLLNPQQRVKDFSFLTSILSLLLEAQDETLQIADCLERKEELCNIFHESFLPKMTEFIKSKSSDINSLPANTSRLIEQLCEVMIQYIRQNDFRVR
eukprot:CAMPEP_0115017410 /NCGR_PEP_ID=MMETSP0216-20121206/28106_1 /TAXON_ID=223996 /ORGANISM="Protocruzia adherens, Strain Boccale" /LENGTH=444 /DNA_ID=CAMNT_0002388233 /DNA_START=625 /DNA_END=1956 /DNA_ORIENTATION=-